MDTISQDLRYAVRMLRKSPAFTLVAVAAIALGSAAVTTIYSVVNTVLLGASPGVGHPESLVSIQKGNSAFGPRGGFSVIGYPLYRDLRDRTRTLSGLAAYTEQRMDVGFSATDAREALSGQIVTGNYFDVLQVKPAAGRFFLPEEDRTPGTHAVAVISWTLWKERFGGSPSAIGSVIQVQAVPFTIVGVAPEKFNGTVAMVTHDVYVPMMMLTAVRHDGGTLLESRGSGWLQAVGRLAPGISQSVAQAELEQHANAAEREHGVTESMRLRVAQLRPIPANGVNVVAIFMTVLMVVAGLVLMIASVNVASMLLARGVARRKEFTVRLAIGATRRRLVRQLLTESVLLFVCGGMAGVLLTWWITTLAARVDFHVGVPMDVSFPIDGRVLGFTLAVSLVTGVLFGLVPALNASRRDLAGVLRADSAGAGARRERTRNVFVVGQLAMSVLLLVCAGLFVRAFAKGRTVDPGFRIDHVVLAPISLANAGYDSARAAAFYAQLEQRLAARPDVEAVSVSDMVPLATNLRMTGIDIPGVQPPRGMQHTIMAYQTVGRDFFRVIQLPLRSGRAFTAGDTPTSARVAVVTERFAKKYWPSGDALGKTFTLAKHVHTIVGVVGDGRFTAITNDPEPYMFLLSDQDMGMDQTLFLRSSSDVTTIAAAVAQELRALDPLVTQPKVESLESASSIGLLPQRIAAAVTAVLGVVGLMLATLGLYGVIAYAVSQRTRELGIRMALGAEPGGMVRMVVGEGLGLAGIGLAIGMVIALAASRLLARFLFGVSPLDPLTMVAVPAVLGAVALLASWIPARRAAHVELATALRGD